jgi:transposase
MVEQAVRLVGGAMATERLSMRQIREILRQKWKLKRSHREVGRSVGVSPGTVGDVIGRAKVCELDWSEVETLTDPQLEERLYGAQREGAACLARPMPDPVYIHTELRKPGVTLQLLHVEYLEKNPAGYRYTTFCEQYKRWVGKHSPVMRQTHHAGDKLFVDYSGNKPKYVDASTGEVIEVELFVAVLGASNYTYAEATRTQTIGDWIGSHMRAMEYFAGVTRAIVPDQLKTGVTKACRYEPGIQRTYDELAEHYGTTILPARPAHARDKAKVEVGVLIAQRWILARLRNQTFFSLEELNMRIAELVEDLNNRTMRVYKESRRQLFERLERAVLLPLPTTRFEWGEWKLDVGVNIDYHIDFDGHYYSVPNGLVHERVDVRATPTIVEIYQSNERVTLHVRSYERGRHTTKPEHMPKAHQKHLEWTPSRIVGWAATVGTSTAKLAEAILAERRHPEQGYRSCLGILRLGKKYGHARLEAACARALTVGARSYRHVESILKHGLDRIDDSGAAPATRSFMHNNVRGSRYYN